MEPKFRCLICLGTRNFNNTSGSDFQNLKFQKTEIQTERPSREYGEEVSGVDVRWNQNLGQVGRRLGRPCDCSFSGVFAWFRVHGMGVCDRGSVGWEL
jgi:hypothetical protein